MGRLMATTVAPNNQGQIPLVQRPQRLLGQRELLLLHACLLSLLDLAVRGPDDPDRREGWEVTS
jgi:hypothetical protein